jgi:hypothetical protein
VEACDKSMLTKSRFLKLLIISVLLLLILLIGVGIYKLNGIKSSTISSILNSTVNSLEAEMTITLENTHSQLKIAQEWGNNGLIVLNDEKKILNQFSPLLEQFQLIKSIKIVSDNGNALVLYKKDNWYLYKYYPNQKGRLVIFDKDKNIVSEKSIKNTKNYLSKNWYKNAKIERYSFFYYDVENTNNVGTISIRWKDKKNNQSGVIAFEISIDFVNQIYKKLGQHGFAFLIDDSNRILNIGDTEITEDIINKITNHLNKNKIYSFTTFSFKSDKVLWWVGIKPLKKNSGVFLSVIIPEKDILPDVSKQKHKWYFVFGIIFLLAIILIYLLVKSYNNSLDRIDALKENKYVDKETEILNLIKQGEDSKTEFKSTVRMNLKSGKFGKEIEKAWLKNVVAFLNTDGGTILLGVADDGEIVGINEDKFKNKDGCMLHITNLIKAHIGIEFNSYINIECHSVKGKDVVVIEVKSSPEPAFLHMSDNDEEFYVRSGPSSVSLTISKAIKYINDKKNKNKSQKS